MSNENRRGRAQTVLGMVDGKDLGVTLAHEHIYIDGTFMFVEPAEISQRQKAHEEISLENRDWVGYHWTSNWHNVELKDEETAVSELGHFVAAGGRTIVDPTNIGLARDPVGLARVARLTNTHVIMGSGYYIGPTHPDALNDFSEDDVTREIIRDIKEGVGDTGIRAGLIGEIGCTYPWWNNEKKSLRAAIEAQKETGAALMVHPGREPESPVEIAEIVDRAGGDLSRTIICHIDRTCLDRAWLKDLAETGIYLEYDLYGNESSHYPPNPKVDMPSDAQRMDAVLWHFEQGYERQILLSHDIATKHRLHAYGGPGYDHLITNIIPRLRKRGLSEEQVATVFVDNPATVFSFV